MILDLLGPTKESIRHSIEYEEERKEKNAVEYYHGLMRNEDNTNSMNIEDGFAQQARKGESDTEDNYSLTVNSDISRSSDTSSSKASVSSYAFANSEVEEDAITKLELGMKYILSLLMVI